MQLRLTLEHATRLFGDDLTQYGRGGGRYIPRSIHTYVLFPVTGQRGRQMLRLYSSDILQILLRRHSMYKALGIEKDCMQTSLNLQRP